MSGVGIFFLLVGVGVFCLIQFYSEEDRAVKSNETTNNGEAVETLDSILKDYISELKRLNNLSTVYFHTSSRLNVKNEGLGIPRFKFKTPEITKIIEGASFQILFTTRKDDDDDVYGVNIILHMNEKKLIVLEASYGYDWRVHTTVSGPWFAEIKEAMKSNLNAARAVNDTFINSFEEQFHKVLETRAGVIKELANTYKEVQHV